MISKGPWGVSPTLREVASTSRQWSEKVNPSPAGAPPSVGWVSPARYEGLEPPRREWMVESCFAKGTVGMLSGDGDIGKSTLMMQLCCSAALGINWIGLHVRPGRALYMGCEDDNDEIWRRASSIIKSRDYGDGIKTMGDLGEGLLWASFVGQSSKLIEFERFTREPKPTPVFHALQRQAIDFGAQYVVIDTATKTFSGNQNDELQVDAYISLLRRLAISIQGCVIVTKHPSLSGRALGTGESGNVAWNNSVRARLYFASSGSGRELRGMKANYGPRLPAIPLRWERGVFVRDIPPPEKHWSEVD